MGCATHIQSVVENQDDRIEAAIQHLRMFRGRLEFDAIACTGVSGVGLAAPIAKALNKPLIIVRKDDDKTTHSDQRIEAPKEIKAIWRVIIVDDFVCSGATLKRIYNRIFEKFRIKCFGIFKVHDQNMHHCFRQIDNWGKEIFIDRVKQDEQNKTPTTPSSELWSSRVDLATPMEIRRKTA